MSQDKLQAYAQTQKSSMSSREIEAMAFTKAALKLEDTKKSLDDYDAYASALKFNQLLWTIIQADIVDQENQLPDQLKANILSLSIFVDRQTIKALSDTSEKHLDVLININKKFCLASLKGFFRYFFFKVFSINQKFIINFVIFRR